MRLLKSYPDTIKKEEANLSKVMTITTTATRNKLDLMSRESMEIESDCPKI